MDYWGRGKSGEKKMKVGKNGVSMDFRTTFAVDDTSTIVYSIATLAAEGSKSRREWQC